jgi:hypothetical protein
MESVQEIIEFVRLKTLVAIHTSAEGNFKELRQGISGSKQPDSLIELF